MNQLQTKVKIAVSPKVIVYHNMTIEICNQQLSIKTLFIPFEFC